MTMLDILRPGKRPDHKEWMPHANAGDSDRIAAYKAAAKKLGLDIEIGWPVPAPAGADLCASMGMKGIYIRRIDAARNTEFRDEFFKQLYELTN